MFITFEINQSHSENRKKRFLLRQLCFLTFLFALPMNAAFPQQNETDCYRLAFWNVENLFDIWDDTTTMDDAFTPEGENHWNMKRYKTKLNHLYQALAALGATDSFGLRMPLLIGMAEVENDKVLRDLCNGTPLRKFRYDFIHYDSPDRRGIDNALLFRRDLFHPFASCVISNSDSSEDFFTRDMLQVCGTDNNGDTIIMLVNHFPSKRGGATADRRRMMAARRLRTTMDSLSLMYPSAAIVVVGDFNASPDEAEIAQGIMRHGSDDVTAFVNLMETIAPGRGSYKYQDHWSCIDQIIVSVNLLDSNSRCPFRCLQDEGQLFEADFMLLDDEKFLGKKIYRTYLGMRYQGGFSDHLPVYIDIVRKKENPAPSGRD